MVFPSQLENGSDLRSCGISNDSQADDLDGRGIIDDVLVETAHGVTVSAGL